MSKYPSPDDFETPQLQWLEDGINIMLRTAWDAISSLFAGLWAESEQPPRS